MICTNFAITLFPQLVNYTANLTEERDELNASLEEAKKSLQREMATRIALESRGQMPLSKKVRPHAIISYDRSAAVANALEPRLAWFRLLVWSPSVSVSGRGVSRAARSSGMRVEVVACVACVCVGGCGCMCVLCVCGCMCVLCV